MPNEILRGREKVRGLQEVFSNVRTSIMGDEMGLNPNRNIHLIVFS